MSNKGKNNKPSGGSNPPAGNPPQDPNVPQGGSENLGTENKDVDPNAPQGGSEDLEIENKDLDPNAPQGGTEDLETESPKLDPIKKDDKKEKESKKDIRGQISKEVFQKNKELSSLYFTSDNQAFSVKNFAENHARTLDDKNIVEISRPK